LWRLVKKSVELLLTEIMAAIGESSGESVSLVFSMTDNAFYLARAEDVSLLPHCCAIDGIYHMGGDVVCSPIDSFCQVFLQIAPMLKELDHDKLLLVPLPRYLRTSCCADPEHGPNVYSEDHPDAILNGLAAVHKLWRGMVFRDRLRNLKFTNVSMQLASRELWQEDAVHLTDQGYTIIACHILQGIAGLEARRLPGEDNLDTHSGMKRAGQGELTGREIPKRQLTSSGYYVERQEQHRGRGGWRPYGGRLFLGGGWPRCGNFY
jgi:hypothetical protein